MSILGRIKRGLEHFRDTLPGAKEKGELSYWYKKLAEEGTLRNDHYEFLYTGHWDLAKSFYDGKRILDIGCGPRGSLEWADNALERIGIDSLADDYVKELGADKHAMKYEATGMEDCRFPDGYFDVVCSVNSLDHVADVDKTISQVKRVTKPGGLFLLLVEVNHEPTVTEPITLGWEIVDKFKPEFEEVRIRHYEFASDHSQTMTETIKGKEYDHSNPTKRTGMLSAMLKRV